MIGGTTLIGMADQTYQPSLSQLRAFVSVAEHRHFGTAAARLSVSQPTLSQALAALESGLGVQLIERSTRRVLVTGDGQRLLSQAKLILEAADGFVASAAGIGDRLAGPLRIGLIPTVAPYILPSLLPALRASMPTVALTSSRTKPHDCSTRCDRVPSIWPCSRCPPAPGLIEIPLYDEDFVLVVPVGHPLAGRSDLTADVLDELPLLLLDDGHCLRDQTLDLCRSVDAHPLSGDTRATSLATIVQCVAGGLGVTLVPESAVPVESRRGELATATFTAPAPGRTIGLVFRSSSGRAEGFGQLAEVVKSVAPGQTITQ